MTHVCKKAINCKFLWGSGWCGKVVKCPKCNKKLTYKLACEGITFCPYYQRKPWWQLWDGWGLWGRCCKFEYLE